jgi:hypothetical protein
VNDRYIGHHEATREVGEDFTAVFVVGGGFMRKDNELV